MQDCCLTCKNLEYRKNYVYPYRCLKHKAERFSEKELERMYFSGEECKDFEQRRWPDGHKSGYVIVEHDGEEIRRVLEAGKIENNVLLPLIAQKLYGNGYDVAIEMIAGMGMTVGQEVFDTCVWIGRFWQTVLWQTGYGPTRIFRREEKLDLCGSLSAKDANIRQALVDRYAPGQPNFGKGTKKNPGFFYGFSADMWAAMAVAVTYFDKYIRGVKL